MGSPRSVLVVDDDDAIVNLMRDFLEAEGFHVEAAKDARLLYYLIDYSAV